MDTQVRLRIDTRMPFADGMAFGEVGPYERLAGRVLFAIDPNDPANRAIVDLDHAPRNAAGLVEYATDVYILKPFELGRGNRRLLYDVNNRGNIRAVQFFNDAHHSNTPSTAAHAGTGFLMRRGYTVVASGWQGDILPGEGRLTIQVPMARENGSAITGVVRTEFLTDEPGVTCFPLSGNDYTSSYEAVSLDTRSATFTSREHEADARQPIPSEAWQFAQLDGHGTPKPSTWHCYLPAGFRPGWIYELIYTAKNPLVLGLGFTGVRDLIAFLLHADADAEGTANPLKQGSIGINKVYGWGRSQSGRFLREFVYRGFNQDMQGRRVFDAISPHVAGSGRVILNYRFAQPGRHPRQHEDHLFPSDQFPFAYHVLTDPLTGKTDGILHRPETDPLVIHTQTASEYWQRRGSLAHTDPLGHDLRDHERARVFLFSSSQHHADPNSGPLRGAYRGLSNPLNTTPLLRALLDALDAWATHGTPPPASRVPTRTDGTLASAAEVKARFPQIPGVIYPSEPDRLFVQEHGPEFERGMIAKEPPEEDKTKEYAVLVPQVDVNGNDLAGVRTPHIEVPLATFTGWNLRLPGCAENDLASLNGSYLPFAKTADERSASGDPRPSLQERYRSRAHYVRAIAMAAQRLVEQRLLLEEDADRYVALAMREAALD
ncbi:MAG: alpha/beta hydrolase domain-containing protein [Candidatus Entotheonellia bacterium]